MGEPVICFGQQPCGFFPKRFLVAKIRKARDLQQEIGGKVVFFCHDSDHDLRETLTEMRDLRTGLLDKLNFRVPNKVQRKYTPLYAKEIVSGWQEETARRLPRFMDRSLVKVFERVRATQVADFCLEMYHQLGLLEGIEVVRSSDPSVRIQACQVDDVFVDVPFRDELVRARLTECGLRLHRGGEKYHELGPRQSSKEQVSPARDTRLPWMQSVVGCTDYVAGAGEMAYLDFEQCPEIQFHQRYHIEESNLAYIP